MPWIKVGEEQPTRDENGVRRVHDAEGNTRPVEFVPYEPLAGVEINVNDMASVADRRFFQATMSNLARSRPFSTIAAADFEDVTLSVYRKFVRGVRHTESGKELTQEESFEFLKEHMDYDDAFVILATIGRQMELSKAKKKSLNSWFGLPTP